MTPLAQRFFQLYLRGQAPDLRHFLADVTDPAQILVVTRLHQRLGWERGRGTSAENYLQWFPLLTRDPEHAIELIYAEFLLREQGGQPPSLAELTRRFPGHAERLREQIGLHRALEDVATVTAPPCRAQEDATHPAPPVAFLANRPIEARPASDAHWIERHPVVAALSALVGRMAAAGCGLVSAFWRTAVRHKEAAPNAADEEEPRPRKKRAGR